MQTWKARWLLCWSARSPPARLVRRRASSSWTGEFGDTLGTAAEPGQAEGADSLSPSLTPQRAQEEAAATAHSAKAAAAPQGGG